MKNGMYEYSDGSIAWYKDDAYHRLDGPAIEFSNGNKEWYKEGSRHRLDGPAVEYIGGMKKWYIEGHLVYSDHIDNTYKFELSDKMKRSIIKHKLSKLS